MFNYSFSDERATLSNLPDDVSNALSDESEHYQDLILVDFVDSFYNLTLKLVTSYRWASEYCKGAKYFMTADDDVYVNINNLLKQLDGKSYDYVGYLHSGSSPERNYKSKYYVPVDIYPGIYYPPYCPGAGYVLSMDTLRKLYKTAHEIPLIYIDDVYTGLLAQRNNIQPVNNHQFYGERKVKDDWCYLKDFVTSHGYSPDEMYKLHQKLSNDKQNGFLCWAKLWF